MKIMYIDCGMGAAGDMLTAALLELLPEEERAAFVREFNSLGIPGVEMTISPAAKCGVVGTHVSIRVNGEEEDEHMHEHEHAHHHEHVHEHTHVDGTSHSHAHHGTADIAHLVNDHMNLADDIKADVLSVYDIIASAESKVHGVQAADIHFHEVGTMDAVADVTAVCMLMKRIGAERVVVSPINTGSGTVRCAHGVLPVPAPATANILIGMPAYSSGIMSELCTPTGAALLKHFAADFGNMPAMTTEAIGYGMGKKDFEVANCVRVMLGESVTL